MRRLKRVDFPTLGRPTIAMVYMIIVLLRYEIGKWKGLEEINGRNDYDYRCYILDLFF